MTEPDLPPSGDHSSLDILAEPIVLKNPLLSAPPLGINRQFLIPLGAHSLSILNTDIFQQRSTGSKYNLLDSSTDDRAPSESGLEPIAQPAFSSDSKQAAASIQRSPALPESNPINLSPAQAKPAKENYSIPPSRSTNQTTGRTEHVEETLPASTPLPTTTNQSTDVTHSPITSLQRTQASATSLFNASSISDSVPTVPENRSEQEGTSLQRMNSAEKPNSQPMNEIIQQSSEPSLEFADLLNHGVTSIEQVSSIEQTKINSRPTAQIDVDEPLVSKPTEELDAELLQAQVSNYQVSQRDVAEIDDRPTAQIDVGEPLPSKPTEEPDAELLQAQVSNYQVSHQDVGGATSPTEPSTLIPSQFENHLEPSLTVAQKKVNTSEVQRASNQSKASDVSPSTTDIEPTITQHQQISPVEASQAITATPIKINQSAVDITGTSGDKPIVQPTAVESTQAAGSLETTQAVDNLLSLESTDAQAQSAKLQATAPVGSTSISSQPTQLTNASPQAEPLAQGPLPVNSYLVTSPSSNPSLQQPSTAQAEPPQPSSHPIEIGSVIPQEITRTNTSSVVARSPFDTTEIDLIGVTDTQFNSPQPHNLQQTDTPELGISNKSNTDIVSDSTNATNVEVKFSHTHGLDHIDTSKDASLNESNIATNFDVTIDTLSAQASTQRLSEEQAIKHIGSESPEDQIAAKSAETIDANADVTSAHPNSHQHSPELRASEQNPSIQLKPETADSGSQASPQSTKQAIPVKTIAAQAAQWLSRAAILFSGADATVSAEKSFDRAVEPTQQARFGNQVSQPAHPFQPSSRSHGVEVTQPSLKELKAFQASESTSNLQLQAEPPLVPNDNGEQKHLRQFPEDTSSTPAAELESGVEGAIQPPDAIATAEIEASESRLNREIVLQHADSAVSTTELQRASDPVSEAIAEKQTSATELDSSAEGAIQPPDAIATAEIEASESRLNREIVLQHTDSAVSTTELQRASNPVSEAIAEKHEITKFDDQSHTVEHGLTSSSTDVSEKLAIDSTTPAAVLQRATAIEAQPESNVARATSESIPTSGIEAVLEAASNAVEPASDVVLQATSTADSEDTRLPQATLNSETIAARSAASAEPNTLEIAPPTANSDNGSVRMSPDGDSITQHVLSPIDTEVQTEAASQVSEEDVYLENYSEIPVQPSLTPNTQLVAEAAASEPIPLSLDVEVASNTIARPAEASTKADMPETPSMEPVKPSFLQTNADSTEIASIPAKRTDLAASTTSYITENIHTQVSSSESSLNLSSLSEARTTIETIQPSLLDKHSPSEQHVTDIASSSEQTATAAVAETASNSLREQEQVPSTIASVSETSSALDTSIARQESVNISESLTEVKAGSELLQAKPSEESAFAETATLLRTQPAKPEKLATPESTSETTPSDNLAYHLQSNLQLDEASLFTITHDVQTSNATIESGSELLQAKPSEESALAETATVLRTQPAEPEKSATPESTSETTPSDNLAHHSLSNLQLDEASLSTITHDVPTSSTAVNQVIQTAFESTQSTSEIDGDYAAFPTTAASSSNKSQSSEVISTPTHTSELPEAQTLIAPALSVESIAQPLVNTADQDSSLSELPVATSAQSQIAGTHTQPDSSTATEVQLTSEIGNTVSPNSDAEPIQADVFEPSEPSESKQIANSVVERQPLTTAIDGESEQPASQKSLEPEVTNSDTATTIAAAASPLTIQPAIATELEATVSETTTDTASTSSTSSQVDVDPTYSKQQIQAQVQPSTVVEGANEKSTNAIGSLQAEVSVVGQSIVTSPVDQARLDDVAPSPESVSILPPEGFAPGAQAANSEMSTPQAAPPALENASETQLIFPTEETFPTEFKTSQVTDNIELAGKTTPAIVQRSLSDELTDPTITSLTNSDGASLQSEALPTLPLVLQPLSTLQSLSDQLNPAATTSHSILQAKTAETIGRPSTQAPKAAATDDLMAEPQTVTVNCGTSQWTNFTDLLQGQTTPSSRSSRSTLRDTATVGTASGDSLIQAKLNEPSETVRVSGAQANATDTAEADGIESADYAKYLEILAHEIYQRLRQRLRVEQERLGRDYAGRLPW